MKKMSCKPTKPSCEESVLDSLKYEFVVGSAVDPTNSDGNPYGLSVSTVTSGLVTKGDLIVSNFNDGPTNTQGLGTTVVGLSPKLGSSPYRIAQSPSLLGPSALTTLPDGTIVVTASQSGLVVMVSTAWSCINTIPSHIFSTLGNYIRCL